jgi:delta 1-pyrroline-5-carboxylate dehydrogenase
MSESGECTWTEASSANFYFYTTLASVAVCLYLLQEKFEFVYHALLWLEYLTSSVPTLEVEMTDAESKDDGIKGEPCAEMTLVNPANPKELNCYDPSTKQLLGHAANMTAEEVHEILVKAKKAQVEWAKTTFAQRRMVLRTIQKYICEHVEDICRVSSRESGKPKLDALMGEILTTCEKIRTICEWGEVWLRPESRPTGPMMMHKSAWVEYEPLGLIVAIAPWNYPFHNSVSNRLDRKSFKFIRFERDRWTYSSIYR